MWKPPTLTSSDLVLRFALILIHPEAGILSKKGSKKLVYPDTNPRSGSKNTCWNWKSSGWSPSIFT